MSMSSASVSLCSKYERTFGEDAVHHTCEVFNVDHGMVLLFFLLAMGSASVASLVGVFNVDDRQSFFYLSLSPSVVPLLPHLWGYST